MRGRLRRARSPAILAAIALAISGCGTGPHAAEAADGVGDIASTGAARCQTLVPDAYDEVVDAKTVTGANLRSWLVTRNGGPYSPSQVDSIPADAVLTVCQMRSSKLSPPGPPHRRPPPDAAIVWLGLGGGPVLDAMGAEAKLSELMARLPG